MDVNTYLGQKGYTIPKNELTIEQQKQIRNDLTIKPFTPGGMSNEQKSFPSYHESNNKFYVPHYYGIENFGIPKKYKISEGHNLINLEFNGQLRENQELVVSTYINHINNINYGGGLLELPCAYGKTILSLNIITRLKRKTFIIVHKEFLIIRAFSLKRYLK